MAGGKRSKLQGAPPQWSEVRGLLHMRLADAAAELNVSITYLRRLCRQNGFPQWPGKKIRYMNSTGKKVMLEVDALGASPCAGLAGTSKQAKIAETRKENEDDDMARIHGPVSNPPPREELTTLNLIEKVGSSPSSSDYRS